MTIAQLATHDPTLYAAIYGEIQRQEENLELIASENFVSPLMQAVVGSVLTNKYAEGTPGKRYYGGCEMVDAVEELACHRANALFGSDYANVQPHSGSQANMAVYMSILQPGDTVLAMQLAAGGHLTHGSSASFSGKIYNFVGYGVDETTGRLDYEAIAELARQHRPKLIVAGASSYPRIIDFARFAAIAKEVGAQLLVDMAHIAGLIAAGCHPTPVPHADFITSTTHKTLRGPRGGLILAREQYRKLLDSAVCPRIQGGPLMHVIAGKALCFGDAATAEFVAYQRNLQQAAVALAAQLQQRGYQLVTGGTDNHLLLVDLRQQQLTGKVAEKALEQAGIAVNKNMIYGDPEYPWVTSGIRLGTAALVTRGLQAKEMPQVADFVDRVLQMPYDLAKLKAIKQDVCQWLRAFPLHQHLLQQLPAPH